MEEGWVTDGVMSQSLEQLKNSMAPAEDILKLFLGGRRTKMIFLAISRVPNF
jgi:hypothetical protein